MNKTMKKILAVWMSMLIIFIPLFSFSTFAIINKMTINPPVGSTSGKPFAATSESVKIEGKIQSTEDLSGRVELIPLWYYDAADTFMNCVVEQRPPTGLDLYKCTATLSAPGEGWVPSAYTVSACVQNDLGNCIAATRASPKTFYIDGLSPTINSMTLPKDLFGGKAENIAINYETEDKIAPNSPLCNGIRTIDVIADNDIKETVEVNTQVGNCKLEGTVQIMSSVLPDGIYDICLRPVDYVGNYEEVIDEEICKRVAKESIAPVVQSIEFYPALGFDNNMKHLENYTRETPALSYFAETTNTRIIATVQNQGYLNVSYVEVDLSNFGISEKLKLNKCVEASVNGVHLCTADPKILTFSEEQTIPAKAVDKAGNGLTDEPADATVTLTLDNTPPEGQAVRTLLVVDGESLTNGRNYTLVAILDEEGSGFYSNQVEFKVDGAAPKYGECFKESNWLCYLRGNQHAGADDINIVVNAKDDSGHKIVQPLENTIKIDKNEPEIKRVYVRHADNRRVFVAGDAGMLGIDIEDGKGVLSDSMEYRIFSKSDSLSFNSERNQDGYHQASQCGRINESDPTRVRCEWEVSTFHDGDIKVQFDIYDVAGNRITDTDSLSRDKFQVAFIEEILKFLPEDTITVEMSTDLEEVDFWDVEVGKVNPKRGIDSKTAEIVQPTITAVLEIIPKGEVNTIRNDVDLAEATIAGCQGEDWENYGDTFSTLVFTEQSLNPMVRLKLRKGAIEKSKLTFNCSMNIYSYYDDKVVNDYETDTFTFNILVSNHESISSQIKKEIEDVMDGKLVKADWLGRVEYYMAVIDRGCQVYNVLSTLRSGLAAIEAGLSVIPLVNFIADGIAVVNKGIGIVVDTLTPLQKLCAFLSCSYAQELIDDAIATIPGFGKFMAAVAEGIQEAKEAAGERDPTRPVEEGKSASTSQLVFPPVTDNLILSSITLCPKGIVTGLNKIRQIECNYVVCLDKFAQHGLSTTVCKNLRKYNMCTYIYGQTLELIPFSKLIEGMTGTFQKLLGDPIALIVFAANMACRFIPNAQNHSACVIIAAAKQYDLWERTRKGLLKAFDSKTLPEDVCVEAKKIQDRLNEEEEEGLGEGEDDTGEQDPLDTVLPPQDDTPTEQPGTEPETGTDSGSETEPTA